MSDFVSGCTGLVTPSEQQTNKRSNKQSVACLIVSTQTGLRTCRCGCAAASNQDCCRKTPAYRFAGFTRRKPRAQAG